LRCAKGGTTEDSALLANKPAAARALEDQQHRAGWLLCCVASVGYIAIGGTPTHVALALWQSGAAGRALGVLLSWTRR
jgi:hypothetical protein